MQAPIRSATSPRPAPQGRGDRDGLRDGPLRLPHLSALGLGLACEASTGRMPPGPRTSGALEGGLGLRGRDLEGQGHASGHWEIAGVPVDFDWGYFPNTVPSFPEALTDALIARGQSARHPRQQARLGDRHHRRIRRRARADRQADLLHLRRQRAADRGPRGDVRPRAALRALPHRARALRPAQYRPRHRASVRGHGREPASRGPATARISPRSRPATRSSTR